MFSDYINSPALFWTALAAFVTAVLFHLWLQTKAHIQKEHERAHPERIDKALYYFRTKKTKRITNDLWQEVTGVSDSTATRDLHKLVELGVLREAGAGRAVHYIFNKHRKGSSKK